MPNPLFLTPELLDDATLDTLASISLSDLMNAAATWRLDSPFRYKRLLDAISYKVVLEQAAGRLTAAQVSEIALQQATRNVIAGGFSVDYTWDEQVGRFRTPRGDVIPRPELHRNLDATLLRTADRARIQSQKLRAGTITLQEWQQSMRGTIKDVHLYSAANARGGWARMTSTDFGRVGPRVRYNYGKLQAFADEIASGRYRLDGRFLQRVELYLLGGRISYDDADLALQRDELEMDEEQNVLHAADHCGGCEDQSARGWVPIGKLIRPCFRECLSRCRCTVRYRKRPSLAQA